jgi:predicted nucleotidyltransferase/HEPN domain-containing protein
MKTSLDHLPQEKREQLTAIAALVQAESPALMVVLFGSYARGDWVEDRDTLYLSDYDLLVIVADEAAARESERWTEIWDRARRIAAPVPLSPIVHDFKHVNQEIRAGQYFFIDILREGVALHSSGGFTLATPKALNQRERLEIGRFNFRYWFSSAGGFWRISGHCAGNGLLPHAAFLLHQAVERYFHAVLLVFTGYKPRTHDIESLAGQCAPLHPALAGAMPRAEGEDKRLFGLLKRAYIEARYSKNYRVTVEELSILRERVLDLAARVREACVEKLGTFCGPEQVGELPLVPSAADQGELPPVPPLDDPGAVEAWRDALAALSFERGEKQGEERGEQRGRLSGIAEGQARAVLAVLAARGIAVDDANRALIEGCRDAAVLERWIARAAVAGSAREVVAPEE